MSVTGGVFPFAAVIVVTFVGVLASNAGVRQAKRKLDRVPGSNVPKHSESDGATRETTIGGYLYDVLRAGGAIEAWEPIPHIEEGLPSEPDPKAESRHSVHFETEVGIVYSLLMDQVIGEGRQILIHELQDALGGQFDPAEEIPAPAASMPSSTDREVVSRIAAGRTLDEIAEQLSVPSSAIRARVLSMLHDLQRLPPK
jgi:hypothetical protein